MWKNDRGTPELMPTLSAGKHRSPRTGACVMEFASYLAGERWSDRPRCTHPLLAELARGVNDHVSDDARQRLVPLVPSVIGLTSDDPRVDVRLALLAAATALPIAPEPTQRALAVAVLTCGRVLGDLDGDPQRPPTPTARLCWRRCRGPRSGPDASPTAAACPRCGCSAGARLRTRCGTQCEASRGQLFPIRTTRSAPCSSRQSRSSPPGRVRARPARSRERRSSGSQPAAERGRGLRSASRSSTSCCVRTR